MNFEIPSDIKLSTKTRKFFEFYFSNGYNATQAAKDAGYSIKTAYAIGNNILKSIDGKKIVDLFFQTLAENNRLRKEAATEFLLDVLETDLTDFVKVDKLGNTSLKPSNQIPENKRKLINEISISPTGIVKIKTFSKETAREMLNKIEGHYERDNAQKVSNGPNIYIPDNGRSENAPDETGA